MHYKDGTPAKLGDIIKGHGYNVKNEDGTPKELTGIVIGLSGGDTCNLRLGYDFADTAGYTPQDTASILDGRYNLVQVRCQMEYGETKAFEKIG